MRFVVADDSWATRQFVRGCLINDLGYREVYEAENGEQAIELCRKHHPDFVILDINMDPGMNGVDAAAIIAAEGLAGHIMIASHARQDLPRLDKLGYDTQGKPFKREQLAAHIREVIRESA